MPRMTHNTVYPTEPDEASMLEGEVGARSSLERLSAQFPDSPLYTEYDPLLTFSDTVIKSAVENVDLSGATSAAGIGYWGLNGYSRNYADAETDHGGAPNILEHLPDGDESELIGSSFTPSVKSPSTSPSPANAAQPQSETRAPFEGPSADDADAQPSKSSVDIRSRTKAILENRMTLESSHIPSLDTLLGS